MTARSTDRFRKPAAGMLSLCLTIALGFTVSTPSPASASEPTDRVTASWNMQGQRDGTGGIPESRWETGIQQLLDEGVQVASLQEAGSAPPPNSHWSDRVFPTPGVTEHIWSIRTNSRPRIVNIYWADTGQQRNGLAIISEETARNAVQLTVGGRFNSRPMMGVQFGQDWYFNAHARANGENSANDAADIIETARQFIAANDPGANWMVLADFNQNPGRMPANLQNHIVAADAPTHQGGAELDFSYTNTGDNNTVLARRRGLNSDHFYVRYALNPDCRPAARRAAAGCYTQPVPGEEYRFFSYELSTGVLANEYASHGAVPGPPSLQKAERKETEVVRVLFSTAPGRYIIAMDDDWCVTRYRPGASKNVTETPCRPDIDTAQWEFADGQIKIPGSNESLRPAERQIGAGLITSPDPYLWHFERWVDNGSSHPDTGTPGNQALKVMVVGDSMSQGYEGDYTWRYRLSQWFRANNITVDFVGPHHGTRPPDAPAPPEPPALTTSPDTGAPSAANPPTAGAYAPGITFDSDHFAVWGRQAAQVKTQIRQAVSTYQPDLLLVGLGFNDMGWFVSGAQGTLDSIKTLVDEARAAKPDVDLALANVPQRTRIDNRQDLIDNTNSYNDMLVRAIPSWSTTASRIELVDWRKAYDCGPDACPGGYDGLHPNALGEHQIAGAFGKTLHEKWRLGAQAPSVPNSVPGRPTPVPANVKAASSPLGVTVTWDAVFGAYGYDIRSRVSGGSWNEWRVGANRYDTTWTVDGLTWEYQVRTNNGEGVRSAWSPLVSAISRPETALGPTDIVTRATATGVDISWKPATGPHTQTIDRYQAMVYDKDTPGAFLNSVGVRGLSTHIDGLIPGHHYIVAVATWNGVGGGLPRVARPVLIGAGTPGTPANLAVVSTDPTTVQMSWTGASQAAGYHVWVRNVNGGSSDNPAPTSSEIIVDGTTHSIAFLYPGTWNYEFCVSAVNGVAESEKSPCVTPQRPSGAKAMSGALGSAPKPPKATTAMGDPSAIAELAKARTLREASMS
ncbi:fibronectin type III domain-containing protein [Actinoplanes sp. NPDC051859]|uniref:fibronectin type III domain-containing protein n=1 Tax=Actinoplanes sp. NPDC051859 TaxID=3363909 RepID=UPI0037A0CBED